METIDPRKLKNVTAGVICKPDGTLFNKTKKVLSEMYPPDVMDILTELFKELHDDMDKLQEKYRSIFDLSERDLGINIDIGYNYLYKGDVIPFAFSISNSPNHFWDAISNISRQSRIQRALEEKINEEKTIN